MSNSGVRVGKSTIAGKGLFATKPFNQGEVVCLYTGKLYRRNHEPSANRYLVEVNGHWTLDGSSISNLGRWANHSCEPNAKLMVPIKKASHVKIRATRRIEAGEEIFLDYGEEYVSHFLKQCKCPKCREEQ